MKPILKYLKNLFVKQRLMGNNSELDGLVKADMLLQTLANEKKVPGIAITVLKQGSILMQKGYGYSDLDLKTHVHPQKTIFRIASASKPIAATALAYAVAEGKIDLDTSFYEYVPYFPKKQWDFTIRQLASHTAGIRSYQGTEYGLNKPYSIKKSIEIFKDDDLLFEPGSDYHYNSYDWVLISLAIQEVCGIPFEKYVQERVLKPLKMVNTFAPELHAKPLLFAQDTLRRMATCYTKSRLGGFRAAIPVNNFYKLAGGGYLSTSEDIAKFGQAYLEGKILNKEILSDFLTIQKSMEIILTMDLVGK